VSCPYERRLTKCPVVAAAASTRIVRAMSSVQCGVVVLTMSKQEARKVFEEALTGADVERNAEGQIRVDGATIMAWTTNIPE
jgi:hypothetical protein